jgi:3-methyladenine DNA glycosylase/8-oxoguanine DNA glycosylase
MATLAKPKPPASAGHIERFTRKLNAVKQAVASLPGDDFHNGLITVIHRPGWTTIAEGLFFEALADSILAQTQHVAQLHQQLKAAAEAVGQD